MRAATEAKRACIVYGARGHGKVVADALRSAGLELRAFVDDDPALAGATSMGVEIHDFEWLRSRAATERLAVALGIGDNGVRRASATRCTELGFDLQTVIHPSAVISMDATIGAGVVVLAAGVVNPFSIVGTGVLINTGAIVEHDVEIGAWAHVSPNAVLAGGSKLGEHSHLGASAVVIDDLTVGARSIVGAGSVVVRHIPDGVVAYGNPCRVRRRVNP